MHDFLEGVCKYVLKVILDFFIYKKNYFTLDTLNARFQQFPYNRKDSNKPPTIKKTKYRNQINLKMSASEMSCFIRYLGPVIADLIPEGDDYCRLFLYLKKVADILLSPRFTLSWLEELKIYLYQLCSLYMKLGGTLKPKFHFCCIMSL